MSSEHVIPDVLGGILRAPMLCADCNSWCGAQLDRQVQADDSLRLAALALGERLPQIRDRVLHKMKAASVSDRGATEGDVRYCQFKVRPSVQPDGSLIQSTEDGRKAVEQILRKRGADESTVIHALAKFDGAPFGQRVSLHPDLDVIQWQTKEIRQVLKGETGDDRPFIKIAVEFACLTLGRAAHHDGIAAIWNDLRAPGGRSASVDYLQDQEYEPFHGIAIEQNQPVLRVQVRLFGKLAYRITFPKLAVNGPRWVYTHRLDLGEDSIAQP